MHENYLKEITKKYLVEGKFPPPAAGILPSRGSNRCRRGSSCRMRENTNIKLSKIWKMINHDFFFCFSFPHHVCRLQSEGSWALVWGVTRGGRCGQGWQASLRRTCGVWQTVTEPSVLVFKGRGRLGHPTLGLLQQRPRLWAGLLPLQTGVLIILSLLRRSSTLILSRGESRGCHSDWDCKHAIATNYKALNRGHNMKEITHKTTYNRNLHNFTGFNMAL